MQQLIQFPGRTQVTSVYFRVQFSHAFISNTTITLLLHFHKKLEYTVQCDVNTQVRSVPDT